MIAREPLAGVGFGEFNLAWTLTEFPHRPTAFFDHTHNLPLHLMVELGIPLGLLVFGCCWPRSLQAGAGPGPVEGDRRARQTSVVHAGLDDRPAQHAGVPAVVRLFPAAHRFCVGIRAVAVARCRDGG